METELNDYLQYVINLNDPVVSSITFTVFFIATIYVLRKCKFFLPYRLNIENKRPEMKNIKFMALFAELSPDPMIRIDEDGTILHANEAARIIEPQGITGRNIRNYLPALPANITALIKSNASFPISVNVSKRFYEVWFNSYSRLHYAQLYFKDLTERNLMEQELTESKKQLQCLTMHLYDSIEEERKTVASKLHDSVGQNLLFIKLLLQECTSERQFRKIRGKISNTLDSTLGELKNISHNLKPTILYDVDLPSAIIALSNKIMSETKLKGNVDIVGTLEKLPNKTEISLYRIIQEALTNIVKHSNALHFSIQILSFNDCVKVIITDDGIGFEFIPDPKSHFGLSNIKERVDNLLGTFKIESSYGRGTVLLISIPKDGHESTKKEYKTINS